MKTKTNILSIVLVVLLSASAFVVVAPFASAHDPAWTIQRYAFATAAPNPVGVNQPVAIVIWADMPPPTAVAATGDRWTGFNVDITKPDGTTVNVLSDGHSDPVGSSYALYVPDMAGTYTVNFSFPEQMLEQAGYTGIPGSNSVYIGDVFSAASTTTTFTVQEQTVDVFQEAELPVSYWTRPINENNRDWSSIGSAWLGSSGSAGLFGATYLKYNPYGWAPNTAHVSMTYPLSWGGIVGEGEAIVPDIGFFSGTQYQLKFSYPIIMYGNVYFSLPVNNANSGNGIVCVSLRTGETLWVNEDYNTIMMGQLYDFESPNQHGVTGIYLWASGNAVGTGITNPGAEAVEAISGNYPVGTNLGGVPAVNDRTASVNARGWVAIDPQTGKLLNFNLTDVPSGTQAQGSQGEWLIYNIGGPGDGSATYLYQWNNTKIPGNDIPNGVTQWRPRGNYNMSTAYDWNVTLSEVLTPKSSPIGGSGFGVVSVYNETTGLYTTNPTILRVFPGNVILGQSSGLQQTPGTSAGILGTPDPFTLWAINLDPTRGDVGEVLWVNDYEAPGGNITVNIGPADGESNVFTLYYKQLRQWVGFDMLTGEQIWGPTESENGWNFYTGTTGLTNPVGIGYGNMYVAGYGGTLYAYNLTTGEVFFTFGNDISDPMNSTHTAETVYGHYPTQVAAVADGKVYLVEEEHSLDSPAYRGAKTRCVDAFTGELLWDIYGISSWQSSAVADGYYTWLNYNDMQIYAMGPGPSATTVDVQTNVISLGSSVEITGTVTDQTPQAQLQGTPAVSDADQGMQMQYLIQQSVDKPTDISGVSVHLTAIDPNGNCHDIATVTSSGTSGLFHYLWTPPVEGEYVITAVFEGSQAYGPSSAETAFGVVKAEASVATPTPSDAPGQPTTTPGTTTDAPASPSPSTAAPPSSAPMSEIYIVAAAVVIIAVIAAAALILRRRQ
ncbi:MAG: PQQ-binding-like beta-propeller repeat protein [Candidatus Bathyarchaeota archaeon]|nr:PQQ-binding-like beta-propeller repeat protein [Candidatus Bathyarchaeota archaeon]